MGHIILLACAAAVFPTLIGCVAIIISRPQPRGLLTAFYAGGLIASLASGVVVLAVFDAGDSFLASTTSTPSPGNSIVAGLASLLLAWLMASRHGEALLDRWRSRHPRRRTQHKGPSWAERQLDRATARVAFLIGAAINLPGPFYLLALGDMATGGYSTAQQLGLLALFNAIMFVLIEVPLVGYLRRPQATARWVAEVAAWLNGNGLRVMGWLVGAVGTSLIVRGIAAALG